MAFSGGVGYADVDSGIPMSDTTQVGIDSLTKGFTSIMIGQLVQEGKLDTKTLVKDVIPWFESQSNPNLALITVDHLLSHTSGIRRDGNTNHGPGAHYADDQELMQLVGSKDFTICQPDDEFMYSNLGYGYAGKVIEAVTGKPYAVNLQERILDPLGMHNTYVDTGETATQHPPIGYEREVFGGNTIGRPPSNALVSAHGIISTAADMSKYMTLLMTADKGSTSALGMRMMRSSWLTRQGFFDYDESYGRGFDIYTHGFGHSGNFEGSSSHLEMRTLHGLHRDTGIVLLANVMSSPVKDFSQQIFQTLNYFRDYQLAYAPDEKAYLPEGRKLDIQKYVGFYRARWADVHMVDLNGHLVSFILKRHNLDPLLGKARYIPTEKSGEFTIAGPSKRNFFSETLTFDEDSNGNVKGYAIGTNGTGSYHEKIEIT